MLRSARLTVSAVVLAVSGCGHSAQETVDQPTRHAKTSRLRPGELDYPVDNPSPSHSVQFIAIVPPSLSIRFQYGYRASVDQKDADTGDTACQRQVAPEIAEPLFVEQTLSLVQNGDTYRGTFAIDRFQPGICNWAFSGISALADDPSSRGTLLAAVYDDHGNALPDDHLDEWCIKAPAIDPEYPEICLSLKALQRLRIPIPADFVAAVPLSQQDDGRAAHVGPNSRTITVQFHDVDALLESRGAH